MKRIEEGWAGGRMRALVAHIRLSLFHRRIYTLHCWASGQDADERGYTCMRAAGHFGGHAFEPDSDIEVAFT